MIYVLDTSVMLSDPKALERLASKHVVIPLIVLTELEAKRVHPELGYPARTALRLLEELRKSSGSLTTKIDRPEGGSIRVELNNVEDSGLPAALRTDENDNRILAVASNLAKEGESVTLVTKDMPLRLKASVAGLFAEDYGVEEKDSMDWSGVQEVVVSDNFLEDLFMDGQIDLLNHNFPVNTGVILKTSTKKSALGRINANKKVQIIEPKDPLGLRPRNAEQSIALDILGDNSIGIASLGGLAGSGKGHPLGTKILTVSGFKPIEDLVLGETLVGSEGQPITLIGVFDRGVLPTYRVVFSDRTSILCDGDHIWNVQNRSRKKNPTEILTTTEIMENGLKTKDYGYRSPSSKYFIPLVDPVIRPEQDLPIHPYVMGVLLANGYLKNCTISTNDDFIVEKCKNLGIKVKAGTPTPTKRYQFHLLQELKALGLRYKKSREKFVPPEYIMGSIDQRLELLQGLMDCDGSGNSKHTIYHTRSPYLRDAVIEIVQSLGGTASYTTDSREDLDYNVFINLANFNPFSLPRKAEQKDGNKKSIPPHRAITSIERVEDQPIICLMVDAEDSLYVAENHIVTHNTIMALAAGLEAVTKRHKYKKVIVFRPVYSVGGQDLGFLPGTAEEKMAPWTAAIVDAMESFLKPNEIRDIQTAKQIEVLPLTHIRGRTLKDSYVIIDEAQNLDLMVLVTALSRMGQGSKVVMTHDVNQRDNLRVGKYDGIARVISTLAGNPLFAHVSLSKSERSEIAELVATSFDV